MLMMIVMMLDAGSTIEHEKSHRVKAACNDAFLMQFLTDCYRIEKTKIYGLLKINVTERRIFLFGKSRKFHE
mgnify:FL=1